MALQQFAQHSSYGEELADYAEHSSQSFDYTLRPLVLSLLAPSICYLVLTNFSMAFVRWISHIALHALRFNTGSADRIQVTCSCSSINQLQELDKQTCKQHNQPIS